MAWSPWYTNLIVNNERPLRVDVIHIYGEDGNTNGYGNGCCDKHEEIAATSPRVVRRNLERQIGYNLDGKNDETNTMTTTNDKIVVVVGDSILNQ